MPGETQTGLKRINPFDVGLLYSMMEIMTL